MESNIITVQLRSTIFLQQNIVYTPENATKFQNLLMPNSEIYNISQPGMTIFGMNPNMPQYGMPWRLCSKSNEEEYNIAFQLGKIDIILAKENTYNSDIEENFCKKSSEWFSRILETQGNIGPTRIAYAPLYAIPIEEDNASHIWSNLLNTNFLNSNSVQDINISYLLKSELDIQGVKIPMNLLHNIFDGNQIKKEGDSQKMRKVLLIQLDLNSVSEEILNLKQNEIAEFFTEILKVKNNLIKNVTL